MREWMNLVEGERRPHHIEVNTDEYSVHGSVMDATPENVSDWLGYNHGIRDPKAIELICQQGRVVFLDNITVEEDSRGQGLGNQLLTDFLEEAVDQGAMACVLVADTLEDQTEGFDLQRWYERWGFKVIAHEPNGNPLMMLKK